MVKPILKIELPSGSTKDDMDKANESLKESTILQEYHILVCTGNSDSISVEIITASDIKLHQPYH